jgi:hypothetical protein
MKLNKSIVIIGLLVVLITVGFILSGYITSTKKSIILDVNLFQNASRDPYTFGNLKLEGDTLTINVQYVGGCEEHEFELIGTNKFMESEPVQVNILLSHNANNDPCEALITEESTFNLTPLKEAWQQAYRRDSGTIIIWLEGLVGSISYEF